MINKANLIKLVLSELETSLASAISNAHSAHQDATHEQSKAETQYDSLGIEMAYLAEGQAKRITSLKQEITTLTQFSARFTQDAEQNVVQVGSLVELVDCDDNPQLWCFILPIQGGLAIHYQTHKISVISPNAPLATALLGRAIDDEVNTQFSQQPLYISSLL